MSGEVWGRRRTSFGSQAGAYALGRPSYPAEALRWVLPARASTVLDVGAGTGKLTEGLLELGVDVVAVEPLAEMRAFLPSTARVLAGTAEALPVGAASVDAVFAGQAFHWFDVPGAMTEIVRVLRVGGRAGLLWNLLDDADPWTASFADLIGEDARRGNLAVDQPPPYADVEGMTTPERRLFTHAVAYDADRLVAFIVSRSQTILLPDADRERLVAAVRAMAPRGEFEVPFVCETWRGKRV